ncbi:hypothetical protein JCM1393_12510 [Clostridium carnis]
MFQMFPFLVNGMINSLFNNGNYNNNNFNNNYNNINSNQMNNLFNSPLNNTFGGIFNQVFTSVINNQDLITDIVDTLLNNDTMNSILNSLEDLEMELKDYGDRYLIEGKLPGIDKKNIDIDYNNDHVLVKVKRKQVFSNGRNAMVAIMQEGNDIEKSFYVPNVNSNKIKAVFNSEVLRIYLPKKEIVESNGTIIDVDNFTKVN